MPSANGLPELVICTPRGSPATRPAPINVGQRTRSHSRTTSNVQGPGFPRVTRTARPDAQSLACGGADASRGISWPSMVAGVELGGPFGVSTDAALGSVESTAAGPASTHGATALNNSTAVITRSARAVIGPSSRRRARCVRLASIAWCAPCDRRSSVIGLRGLRRCRRADRAVYHRRTRDSGF